MFLLYQTNIPIKHLDVLMTLAVYNGALFELVDRIEIGEAKKHLGIRIQDVKVFYRYVGCVDDALAQTEQEAI